MGMTESVTRLSENRFLRKTLHSSRLDEAEKAEVTRVHLQDKRGTTSREIDARNG